MPTTRSTSGRAERERAGLVQEDGARPAEALERAGSLDDDAGTCSAGEACHERDRRGQDERAGSGDDHHGQPTVGVAGGKPRKAGDGQREGKEERCVAVGETREGRAVALGSGDEPDDARVRALGSRAR